MLKIGNIIYSNELVNHNKLEFINYYDKNNINNIDYNLPTLIVGWQYLKQINNILSNYNNCSILEKELIKNKLYWEFSFEENKSNHIDGIETYIYNLPYYYFDANYNYILIDPIFKEIKEINQLLKFIPNKIDKIYSYKNEMLYILSNNKIYGIDVKMFNFFNFDINILIELLKKNNKFIYDDGNIYEKYYQSFYFYVNLMRFLVLFV